MAPFKPSLLNLDDERFNEYTDFYKPLSPSILSYTPQLADPSSFEELLNKSRKTFGQGQARITNQINPAYGAIMGMATGSPITLRDNSGTATINPGGQLMLQTNLPNKFDAQGNPVVDPKGWRFGIDAAGQSASIGKGIFDFSAGIKTTPEGTTEPEIRLGFDTKLNRSVQLPPAFMNIPAQQDPAIKLEIDAMRLPPERSPYIW
jgi:hypothetical protein